MTKTTARGWLTLFMLLVSIVLLSCGVPAKNANVQDDVPGTLVTARLGPDYTREFNSSKTYVLFQQQRGADHLRRQIKYIVVRRDDNAIVLDGSFQGGFVKWHDDQSIEVLNTPVASGEGEKKIVRVNGEH